MSRFPPGCMSVRLDLSPSEISSYGTPSPGPKLYHTISQNEQKTLQTAVIEAKVGEYHILY